MTNEQVKRWVSLLAVIAVAVMIFMFSAQNGEESSDLSEQVTEWVLTATVPGYADFPLARKQVYLRRVVLWVRKGAHFSEYALLGLTLSIHLHYALKGRGLRAVARRGWLIGSLYAVTDEAHQMFVGGRGPAVLDVCIDSAGALAGALFGAGLIALWHHIKKKGSRQT